MTTPVLTKKQQRHSLSAKKTPAKGLRNVLAQPHDKYWPLIDEKHCSNLDVLLKELTPAIKRPSCPIPWSQLKCMKKEERQQAKKEALLKDDIVINKELLNSVVTGINAVTRSMEKNAVCCILLDATIEPPLLVRHVIMMAQNKQIPLILVPSLKITMSHTIGYACAALAFKTIVSKSSDHHFYKLYITVLDILKDIPQPKNALQLFKDVDTVENQSEEDIEMSIESEPDRNKPETNQKAVSKDVYKYRTFYNERVFVPPSAVDKPIAEETECTDFISISKYESPSSDNGESDNVLTGNGRYVNISSSASGKDCKMYKRKRECHDNKRKGKTTRYLSLKVKRVQGNSNRTKATKVSKRKRREMEKL